MAYTFMFPACHHGRMHVCSGLRVFRHPTGVDHTCSASNRGYPPPRCSRHLRHRPHQWHSRLRLLLSLWNSLLLIMQSQREACSCSSRSLFLLRCYRTIDLHIKISHVVDNNHDLNRCVFGVPIYSRTFDLHLKSHMALIIINYQLDFS